MELRQLRYFVEIAEQSSFTRAADVLAIAQPALTAQMHKLEAEFGAPLFIRSNRGITLTDVGRAVLDAARTTLHAADATKRAAQLAANVGGARVNIVYSRTYPVTQLARIIRGFRRDRPEAQLDLRERSSNDQFAAVAGGEVDFGFHLLDGGRVSPIDAGIVTVKLSEQALAIAVSSSHRFASRRQIALTELRDEPIVLPRTTGESVRDLVSEATRREGFDLTVVQETADFRLALGLVSAGMGSTLVFSGNRDLRIRDIHYLSVVPTFTVSFGVMYRRGYGGRAIEPLLRGIQREELT